MIDWIFFDVGNVLFNDDPQNYFAFRHVHRRIEQDRPEYTFSEMLADRESHALRGDHWILRKIAERFFSEDRRKRYFAEMKARLIAEYDRNHIPSEGLHELLDSLRSRFRLGIVANQPPECRNSLRRRGLLDHFDVVAISEEIQLFKPDVRLYEWAVEQAGCEPSRAIMVGDRRDNDVAPAGALAMRTILVEWLDNRLKGWNPDDPHAQAFLESCNRVPLFPGVNSNARPDRTVCSLREIEPAVEAIVRSVDDSSS